MYSVKGVFKEHWRLITIAVGIIAVFFILYPVRSTVFPFAIGVILAYLLLPIISWAEKKLPKPGKWQQTKRISLIILAFIIILALVGFMSFYIISSVFDAFSILINNAQAYVAAGLNTLQEWAEFIRPYLSSGMQQQLDEIAMDIATAVGNMVRGIFTSGISFIPSTFGLIFASISLPVFLFYILKDSERLRVGFYSGFSPQAAKHAKNIISILDKVLGRYIRAQVMLGLVVGYLCFIGLLILKVPFAPALAAFAGITEFIPIIGPWMGGIAAVIVTLALAPDKVIWVALLFILVQLLENTLLVPRIQGGYLRIHPAILMVVLALGARIAGFWGILVAAPLTATIVEIFKYVPDNIKADETQQPPTDLSQK